MPPFWVDLALVVRHIASIVTRERTFPHMPHHRNQTVEVRILKLILWDRWLGVTIRRQRRRLSRDRANFLLFNQTIIIRLSHRVAHLTAQVVFWVEIGALGAIPGDFLLLLKALKISTSAVTYSRYFWCLLSVSWGSRKFVLYGRGIASKILIQTIFPWRWRRRERGRTWQQRECSTKRLGDRSVVNLRCSTHLRTVLTHINTRGEWNWSHYLRVVIDPKDQSTRGGGKDDLKLYSNLFRWKMRTSGNFSIFVITYRIKNCEPRRREDTRRTRPPLGHFQRNTSRRQDLFCLGRRTWRLRNPMKQKTCPLD